MMNRKPSIQRAAAGLLTAGFLLALQMPGRAAKPPSAKKPPAAKGVQRATVVIDGGYTPSTVNVKVGKPVELTFVRKEKEGCGDVVEFPTLRQKTRSLKSGAKAVVSFTPKKAGAIPFTCGMQMYKGEVIAK